MKYLIAGFCFAFSCSAFAQITIPNATTTWSVTTGVTTATATKGVTAMTAAATALPTGVTVNSLGEPDDDPQDPVSLTAAEIATVKSALSTADTNIKTEWQKRTQGAKARGLINPQLIKH